MRVVVDLPKPAMATLVVHTAEGARVLVAQDGLTLREVLDAHGLRADAACGGLGACGACRTRVREGILAPPNASEVARLGDSERSQGWRLACQARVQGDAAIEWSHAETLLHWETIPLGQEPAPASERAGGPDLGAAIDLGTTHIRVALWDLACHRRIASRWGLNPQRPWGSDILGRLECARQCPAQARELQVLARDAVIGAVRDMLAKEMGKGEDALDSIRRVCVVGNTAMLALLTGRGSDDLLDPQNWQRPISCEPADSAAWQEGWGLPRGSVEIVPPLAGFVGSDLLASVLATSLMEGPPGSLLLDVGTNTELALWDGVTLHVSSAPGGPALEGVGIRHGVAAGPGAIARVTPLPNGAGFACLTIGNAPVRGFCGTGLVDALAALLRAGLLKPSGRFRAAVGCGGMALDSAEPRTTLTTRDIDMLQRAKAATAAAMEELLHGARMGWQDLRRLCICGTLGSRLDLDSARTIGLIPNLADGSIETHPHAALLGCERVMLATAPGCQLAQVRERVTLRNMACLPGWEDRYLAHLVLAPLAASTERSRP